MWLRLVILVLIVPTVKADTSLEATASSQAGDDAHKTKEKEKEKNSTFVELRPPFDSNSRFVAVFNVFSICLIIYGVCCIWKSCSVPSANPSADAGDDPVTAEVTSPMTETFSLPSSSRNPALPSESPDFDIA
jgi:hypothetical protein